MAFGSTSVVLGDRWEYLELFLLDGQILENKTPWSVFITLLLYFILVTFQARFITCQFSNYHHKIFQTYSTHIRQTWKACEALALSLWLYQLRQWLWRHQVVWWRNQVLVGKRMVRRFDVWMPSSSPGVLWHEIVLLSRPPSRHQCWLQMFLRQDEGKRIIVSRCECNKRSYTLKPCQMTSVELIRGTLTQHEYFS